MNEIKNLNIKLSVNNSLPNLKNFIKNGEMDFSIENMLKVKDLVAKKNLSRNEYNISMSKSENLKNLKKEFSNLKLNENESKKKLIFMNEQQYIRLISPFNFKLASISNHVYTLTNKNLHNLYIICKSAFLNMSSIISKPIISINSKLIKITLLYY